MHFIEYSLRNKCSSNDSDVIQPTLILSNVNTKSLSTFLKEISPFRLFRDRSKKRKLCLLRNNLDVLLYLHNAYLLIAQGKTKHEVIEHLTFIGNNISVTGTSKSILRLIVRNNQILSKNRSEVLFLEEKTSTSVKITSN